MTDLVVDGLSVAFGSGIHVVDDVDFVVRGGRTLALVGESGSGKTLTALSLLRLQPAAASIVAGRARLVGRVGGGPTEVDVLAADDAALRGLRGRRVAMVFQEPMSALNPLVRIDDQIGESLRIHMGLSRTQARAEARSLLDQVGVAASRANAFPHELSGGQRQRVMLAAALAARPEILIADEPTTALDVTVQATVLALLKRLSVERQLGVLLITHDLGVVAEVADDVCVMYAGRIVERGPVDDVLRAPAHPYTRGLLASLPSLAPRGQPLPAIRGAVQPPEQWPTGCRFRDRCDVATDVCATAPPLVQLGARQARCHAVVIDTPTVAPIETPAEPVIEPAIEPASEPAVVEPASILAAPLDHVVDVDLNSTPPESSHG